MTNTSNNHQINMEKIKRELRLYFSPDAVEAIEKASDFDDPECLESLSDLINTQKAKMPSKTTVAEWLKKPVTETDWDINQLMARGTTFIIAGNVGIGKSWESMHLAFQFRRGGFWHGLQCRKLMPIYISLEFTEQQMQKRIIKLANIYPSITDINILADKDTNYRLNNKEGKNNLFKLLRSYNQKFDVIILDPLALFVEGEIQKVNWNGTIEPVLNEIKKEFGCSIIFNHNLRKRIQIYGHSDDMFAPDRLKGASDIIDRADSIVLLISETQPRKDETGKSKRVEITKWIHATKTRDAERELKPHRILWDPDKVMFVPEDGQGWVPQQI